MLFVWIKSVLHTLFSIFLSLVLLFCIWALVSGRLTGLAGDRYYYLRTPSSQAEIKRELSPSELFLVQGESVTLFDSRSAEEILEQYEGEVLFVEESGGVTSYYCYARKLRGGVVVQTYFVNLHIAVAEGRTTVGSPLIFGGF